MNWDDELADDELPAPPDFGTDTAHETPSDDLADDYDPLAAPAVDPQTASQQAAEAAEEDEDWSPEKGFPDPTNAVRIWVDEQGLPIKVRVSLSWREKLRNGALGEAVTQCCLLINHFHHIYGQDDPTRVPTEQPAKPLSPAERAELMAEFDDLAAQLGELEPGSYRTSTQTWQPAVGTDFENGVLVQLDATGRPAFAKFDPKWLATANSKELSTGILSAFKKARANYRPPEVQLTGEGELLQRLNQLSARLLAPPAS